MITKECEIDKICLFCANDYHLEMILLPYIKERLNNSEFIIFTENNLEETIDVLLTKIILNQEIKEKIRSIGWQNKRNTEDLKKYIKKNRKTNIIINGSKEYIREINHKIKNTLNNNFIVIDCFHIEDSEIDIEEISKKYKYILNTQRI